MLAFAQPQKPPQNTEFSPPRNSRQILTRQRLDGDAEARTARLLPDVPADLAHDFSQIPVHRPYIQPKLRVNPVGDRYEREADWIAEQVLRPGHPPNHQKAAIRLKRPDTSARPSRPVNRQLARRLNRTQGRGRPLAPQTRAFFESRLYVDLSGVQIHTDSQAAQMNRQLGARAFTLGRDIYFGARQYRPNAPAGRRLIAHELTHVVQQTHQAVPTTIQRNGPHGRSEPSEAAIETPRQRLNRLLRAIAFLQEQPSVQASDEQFNRLNALVDRLAAIQSRLPDTGEAPPDVERTLDQIEGEIRGLLGSHLRELEQEAEAGRTRQRERLRERLETALQQIAEGQHQTAMAIRANQLGSSDTETLDKLKEIGGLLKTMLGHIRRIQGGSSRVVPLAGAVQSLVNLVTGWAETGNMASDFQADAARVQNTLNTAFTAAGLVETGAGLAGVTLGNLGPVLMVLNYIPQALSLIGRVTAIVGGHVQELNRATAAGYGACDPSMTFEAEPGGEAVGRYMCALFLHRPRRMSDEVASFFEDNEELFNNIIQGVYGRQPMPAPDSIGFDVWLVRNRHLVWEVIYGDLTPPEDRWTFDRPSP